MCEKFLPTGHEGLDAILGGGLPRGQVVEFYGPIDPRDILLETVVAVQAIGGVVAWVDPEALDLERAYRVGVNLTRLLVSQPDDNAQVPDLVECLVRPNVVDLVVATSPIVSTDDGMGMRYASENIRRLVTVTARTITTVVFVTRPLASREHCPVAAHAAVRAEFEPNADVPDTIRASVVLDDGNTASHKTVVLSIRRKM